MFFTYVHICQQIVHLSITVRIRMQNWAIMLVLDSYKMYAYYPLNICTVL
jgi:hypothetical protein